ncbi:MAG: class I SAM-dependent methyltransferase [Anaerolineaceae bacterium]|nr:class I SAM-dependent methyltransferase [Anaerolineaceae bacterium]
MANIILRPKAAPVYQFLSTILSRGLTAGKVLDCGAGGPVPPLAIFAQEGFDCWGIDISDEQLAKAGTFAAENNIPLHLQKADMRQMPFEDGDFDFVFEQFAMCHMSKADIAQTIREMHRVLKPGGLCFLGFISDATFPKSGFGVEQAPGEYYGKEGEHMTLHSMFSDQEAEALLAGWEVLSKQKAIAYHPTDESQYVHLYFILQKV